MAGSKETAIRFMRIMYNLVKTQSFIDDVELVREGTLDALEIINRYKIPSRLYGSVLHYIDTGKVDETLVNEPAVIISEPDETLEPSRTPRVDYKNWKSHSKDPKLTPFYMKDVFIKLSPDLSQGELIGFIKEH